MSTRDAVTAAFRFGLGARPDDLKQIAADPRGYVLASLRAKDQAQLSGVGLAASHEVYREAQDAAQVTRAGKKAEKQAARRADRDGKSPGDMTDASMTPMQSQPASAPPAAGAIPAPPAGNTQKPVAKPDADVPRPQQIRRDAFRLEAKARIERAQTTPTPFIERLVMFWSNHFCVSAAKGPVLGLAGAFEREAIRPNVLGRFTDLLLAVEQHPAMLIYLDNATSTGPNSRAGVNRKIGLNENLAREILELHTLGVDGGYSQDDVTNLARILTGWTVGNVNQPETAAGRFFFAQNRHEPGAWTVLKKSYRNGSDAVGREVLIDLARHPSTARYIARRLARHFVSATPPPKLLARLETTFRDTDGNLAAVTAALVNTDEAWSEPPRKVVPPYDFLIQMSRTFGIDMPPGEVMQLAAALGQPLWRPPSPKGWPDDDDAWMGPSAMRERLRIAERSALMVAQRGSDPRETAGRILGQRLAEPTRQAIARAETRDQGFELLIMSPEFQRR